MCLRHTHCRTIASLSSLTLLWKWYSIRIIAPNRTEGMLTKMRQTVVTVVGVILDILLPTIGKYFGVDAAAVAAYLSLDSFCWFEPSNHQPLLHGRGGFSRRFQWESDNFHSQFLCISFSPRSSSPCSSAATRVLFTPRDRSPLGSHKQRAITVVQFILFYFQFRWIAGRQAATEVSEWATQ